MSDALLPYYHRELSFLRRQGARFAEAHPKIAGRLRLGADSSEDPHVERMLEAFAFLTARVRHKLDDDFPELTEALLGVLYPHYAAPLPSMAVVQLELGPDRRELTAGYTVPRHSPLETEAIQGEPCRFRTCYSVTVWPISVEAAALGRPPFQAPPTDWSAEAASVLRVRLTCMSESMTFAKLGPASLRFFLKGQPQHAETLYELLFNNALGVALANGPDDTRPVLLEKDCLQSVGFAEGESILPYTARSPAGYRLLSEYFAFRHKFLFCDLTGLGPRVVRGIGRSLDVYVFLDRVVPDLEQNLSAETFRLGCTPIVNLYKQRAEPIALTHGEHEYRVVPDARHPLAHEIYAVEHVGACGPDGEEVEYRPFFGPGHAAGGDAEPVYWHGSRRPAEEGPTSLDGGTEVYLSLVDLHQSPAATAGWTVDVETTCLSRDLPQRLPYGGDQPRLRLTAGGGPVSRISCLTPPTRTLRPYLRQGAQWKLVSHLSLGHQSLVDHDDKALALREILKLYDFGDSAEVRKMIDGIDGVTSRHVVSRVRGRHGGGFCRGVEITVHFDEAKFAGSGLFLFASVLERFLALYCSVNSFTKLVATVKGREGELRRWSPRAGEKPLI
jgi:type VI secretion system protein ImpG